METSNADGLSSRRGGGGGGGGGMASGMEGLEMSLHHQNFHQQQQQHQLLPFQASNYASYPSVSSSKVIKALGSEEQDNGEIKRSSSLSPTPSPWQRMKWTDGMIRLLIKIVYCIGDDGGGGSGSTGIGTTTEDEPPQQHKSKKGSATSTTATGLLLLQKKGKWKSVSRAMMEKGYSVSPQQCEDKFNDLNKRYKRVNELLGKGTACQVVENQGLLDTMDHLSPKAKEEARKLLNSKHLFFREMCAYHNGGGGVVGSASACTALPPQAQHHLMPLHSSQQQQQPQCFHQPSDSLFSAKGGHDNNDSSSSSRGRILNREAITEEKEDDENDFDDENGNHDEEEEEDGDDYDDDEDDREEEKELKRVKGSNSSLSASPPPSAGISLSLSQAPTSTSVLQQQLKCDLVSMGGEQQQRQWLKRKATELEEQRLGYQRRALELERQRFKWLRFSSNKEREMEKTKLHNQLMHLENDRMLLLVHRKEQELINNANANANANAGNNTYSNRLQFTAESDHHLHPNLKLMH